MEPARLLVALILLSSALLAAAPPPGTQTLPAEGVVYQLLLNPGLEEYDAPYGQYQDVACQVASGWQRFWIGEDQPYWTDTRVFAASELGVGWVDKIEGETSQMVLSTEPYDAGLWQQVGDLVPGKGYGFAAAMLTIFQTSAQNPVDGTMIKQVGIDPTGGTDPLSSNVIWSPPNDHDQGPWDVGSAVAAHASSSTVTVFVRVNSPYPSGGLPLLNLSFFDSTILAETGTVAAVAPAMTAEESFQVRWDNAVPSPGGEIRWYDVQWLDEAEGVWHGWIAKTAETAATFVGTPGHAYRFRARVWQRYPNGAHLFSPYAPGGDARTCVACSEVWGRVLAHDGRPLVGATVALSGTVYAAASQADGAYGLTFPTTAQPGSLTASLAGWSSPPPLFDLALAPLESQAMTWTLTLPGDAMVNGDFEAGLEGWTAGPGAAAVSQPVHTGRGALELSGAAQPASVRQAVVVGGAWEPALAFWYRPEAAGAGDALEVVVAVAGSSTAAATPLTGTLPVTTTHVLTPSLAGDGWQFFSWQPGPPDTLLTGTVTVEFRLLEDGQDPVAAVYLDEVRLAPTPGGPFRVYLPLLNR